MGELVMKYPFELPFAEVQADLDTFVIAVFSCLESEFLIMPKGLGFIDYPVFEQGYEALKQATKGFTFLEPESLLQKTSEAPIVILVLRTMLGFTPPEWAYLATLQTGVEVSQGFVRALDRKIRLSPLSPLADGKVTVERVKALIDTACRLLKEGAPPASPDKIHRLDKADTKMGLSGLQTLAGMGVPYAMLLYERFLGRPFAGHRDSVSDLVGNSLEAAVEDALSKPASVTGKPSGPREYRASTRRPISSSRANSIPGSSSRRKLRRTTARPVTRPPESSICLR